MQNCILNRAIRCKMIFILILIIFLLLPSLSFGAVDTAIERAKKAQEKIEIVANPLGDATKSFGVEAAPIAKELAEIIAENKKKIESGLITNEMQKNFDARKLYAISKMKKITDKHFPLILANLDAFDKILSESVSATRAAIGTGEDYEYEFKKRKEKIINDIRAEVKRQTEITQNIKKNCNNNTKTFQCQRLERQFYTINRRIKMNQRRIRLAEADVKIAKQNQRIAKLIGNNIRMYGSDITEHLRTTLIFLYKEYGTAQKSAELIGTSSVSSKIAELAKNSDHFWSILVATTEQTSGIVTNVVNSFGEMESNNSDTGSKKSVDEILLQNQQYLNRQSD